MRRWGFCGGVGACASPVGGVFVFAIARVCPGGDAFALLLRVGPGPRGGGRVLELGWKKVFEVEGLRGGG